MVPVALGGARKGALRARGAPPGALPGGAVVPLLARQVPQRAPQPGVVRRHLRVVCSCVATTFALLMQLHVCLVIG